VKKDLPGNVGSLCPWVKRKTAGNTVKDIDFKMATEESMCDQEKAIAKVKGLIRNFPDFPKPGIQFK